MLEAEYAISDRLAAPRGKDARAGAFGGFIGYNSQFENVVLGFELDYTQTRLKGTRSDSISRSAVTSNGYFNEYILSGTATTELEGYGTLRARAGYTSGPFVTGGIALGGIKTSTNVMARIDGHNQTAYNLWLADPASIPIGSIDSYGYTTFNPRNLNGSVIGAGVTGAVSKSTVAVGFTAGAGVDIALTQNIFLRGEYQYAWFDDFNGHKFNVNTIRGGAGVKF